MYRLCNRNYTNISGILAVHKEFRFGRCCRFENNDIGEWARKPDAIRFRQCAAKGATGAYLWGLWPTGICIRHLHCIPTCCISASHMKFTPSTAYNMHPVKQSQAFQVFSKLCFASSQGSSADIGMLQDFPSRSMYPTCDR